MPAPPDFTCEHHHANASFGDEKPSDLFNRHDRECGPNEPGEIEARPLQPNILFQGYRKRPEETLRIMRELWLRTGDIG